MTKKSCFQKIKTKITCLIVSLGLAISAFAGLCFAPSNKVFAYHEDITSSYINDSIFTSYTGSSPYAPSNWTRVTDSEDNGNFNEKTMVGGIFNSNRATDDYMKKYMVLANPKYPTSEAPESGSQSYYSLSLSAPHGAGGNFGYTQTSSNLNLSKNSFYEISITLKTLSGTFDNEIAGELGSATTLDSRASMYLSGFNTEPKNAKFENVESQYGKQLNNDWATYSFYIATNEYKAESALKLQLWLGSKSEPCTGTVFFNQVTVSELDKNTFSSLVSNADTTVFKRFVDLRDNETVGSPITDSSFEGSWVNDWTTPTFDASKSIVRNVNLSMFKDSVDYNNANLSVTDICGNNLRSSDNHVLFVANTEKSATTVETKNDITIKRQGYYKLSLWAWSNSGASTAPSLKLVNTTENRELETASITVATNCKNEGATNGWVNYSFYIYGDAYIDTTCKLQVVLGTSDEQTTGYLYLDDITIKELSYSKFADASSESNSTTFNYNTDSSDYSVSNHDFDITENEKDTNSYPLKPASWTYAETQKASDTTISGVVNTNPTLFNKDNLKIGSSTVSNAYNPGTINGGDANNNVLMMGSKFEGTQTYTSSTFALSTADSYYRITFYANAKQGGANVKIYNSNGYILNLNNITTDGWTKFTTLVKLNGSEEGYYIQFGLTNNDQSSKYAYFDDVVVEKVEESVYTSATANGATPSIYSDEYITKLDRFAYNFEETSVDGSANGFTESTSMAGAYAKVMDPTELGYSAHSGNNALVVNSNSESNGKYVVTTNRKFSVSASSYYKVSFFAKTSSTTGNGATVRLYGTGIATYFDKITDNSWTEYSFYINAKTASELSLDFGFEDKGASGCLLIDDITLEKLDVADEDAFNTLLKGLNSNNNVKSATITEPSSDDNTEDNKKEDEFKATFNWYVVTALITALAIIVAVVGVLIRKINWKSHKKVNNDYDRAKTLDKDLDRRERIAKRQQQIDELQKQLDEIEAEIAKVKAEADAEETAHKSEHHRVKAEIEARRNAIKAEKEQALKERNEKIAKDKNAFTVKEEEEFNNYIKKLEKAEQKENLELSKHEKKVNSYRNKTLERLEKYRARQEFIKAEIARIDAEIEEIAREEAQIWEEYKKAKAEAKQRKAEYKASLKAEKEQAKQEKLAKSKKAEKSKAKPAEKSDEENK